LHAQLFSLSTSEAFVQTEAMAKSVRGSRALASALLIAALGLTYLAASSAFVSGTTQRPNLRARVTARAEDAEAPAPAPAPSSSVALVKITEESQVTTASLLPGLAGLLLLKSVWIGAGLFAVGSYLARQKDSDIATGLKGIAGSSLEVLNFGAYVNDKYEVTGKVGNAFSEQVNKTKKEGSSGPLDGITTAYNDFDKEVGIKDTIGSFLVSSSDLAAQAIDKAVELNDQYKITEQISEKAAELSKGSQAREAEKK